MSGHFGLGGRVMRLKSRVAWPHAVNSVLIEAPVTMGTPQQIILPTCRMRPNDLTCQSHDPLAVQHVQTWAKTAAWSE